MRAYIIRRLLLVIPTLLLLSLLVFFSIRLLPGDLIQIMAGVEEWRLGAGGTEEAVVKIRQELGLDAPPWVQYGRWLGDLVRGDLGDSLWTRRPVAEFIFPRLPVTFALGIMAIIVSQTIALPMGIYSAIRQDTGGDYIGRTIAIALIAIPSFWVGTMVMVFPSLWWHWAPPMEFIHFSVNPWKSIEILLIPALLLGMYISGSTMRMTRTMMLEVLRQDYVRTAWAKGLGERVVIIRHALKNALIPVVTIVGLQMPVLIAGTVVIESIFNLPGVGRLMIFAINERDYTIVSGINMLIGAVVMLINLTVDLTYAYLDPRVKYK